MTCIYTTIECEVERWIAANCYNSSTKVIGFDLEYRPNFRRESNNRTALVQLAVINQCILIQLCHMPRGMPPSLMRLLSDLQILKVGVGIKGDIEKILNDFGLSCIGCCDLNDLANVEINRKSKETKSLKTLVEQYLNVNLSKPKSITMSDWEHIPLSKSQIEYAALDSFYSFFLFQKISALLGSRFPDALLASQLNLCSPTRKRSKSEGSRRERMIKRQRRLPVPNSPTGISIPVEKAPN